MSTRALAALAMTVVLTACGGAASVSVAPTRTATPPASTAPAPTALGSIPPASVTRTAPPRERSPAGVFVHRVHARVHAEYVDHFLTTPDYHPSVGDDGVHTTLEFGVASDGSLVGLRMVESSGLASFDQGVIEAVRRALPLPTPPEGMRSADGNAWLRWRFDRGQRQCGTWNAEPFLLESGERIVIPDAPWVGALLHAVPSAPSTGSQ